MKIPKVGDQVLYTLTEQDCELIEHRRRNHSGFVGNPPESGQEYPMIIVRTWGADINAAVNGLVLIDGNDPLWVTSVQQATELPSLQGPGRTWRYDFSPEHPIV